MPLARIAVQSSETVPSGSLAPVVPSPRCSAGLAVQPAAATSEASYDHCNSETQGLLAEDGSEAQPFDGIESAAGNSLTPPTTAELSGVAATPPPTHAATAAGGAQERPGWRTSGTESRPSSLLCRSVRFGCPCKCRLTPEKPQEQSRRWGRGGWGLYAACRALARWGFAAGRHDLRIEHWAHRC